MKNKCEVYMCENEGVADMETGTGFILTACKEHKENIESKGGQEV